MYVAKIMKHRWEEEPISGIGRGYDGTFAIFFYGCTMRCVYCQNSKISRGVVRAKFGEPDLRSCNSRIQKRRGELAPERATFERMRRKCDKVPLGDEPEKVFYTPEELSDEIIKAQSENVASISFITAALYVDQVAETIKLAKKKGLTLPVVYNSSGYETVAQIKKLDGLIDIYLPDFKYFDNELGKKYSSVPNYADVAKACIAEMHRQIISLSSGRHSVVQCRDEHCEPELRSCNSRVQCRGRHSVVQCMGELCEPSLIIRHLVLPANTENSKSVIKYLYDTYGDDIYISIMSQYTPMPQNEGINAFPELLRKVTKREYEKVVDFALNLGVKNAYIQEGDVAEESFIPDF